jgi:hypothetical protein
VTGLLAIALDAIVADTHTLTIVQRRAGRDGYDASLLCSCGWESGVMSQRAAEQWKANHPCEVAGIYERCARLRDARLSEAA